MLRYFGQAKFTDEQQKIGYELFLREYQAGQWVFPKNFQQISATTVEKLAEETLAFLPSDTQLVSINFDQNQFVDFRYLHAIIHINRMYQQHHIRLIIELTERHYDSVTKAALEQAAEVYAQANVSLCLDDVSTADNDRAMADLLDRYVVQYKFALQNFAPDAVFSTDIKPSLIYWRQRAKAQHKVFAVEGFESAQDLEQIKPYHADILQGFYFAKPNLLSLPA
jgi:EAL domain-containing protein (putative c-di-GMP-specific phosphodiesterase class I)